ncbi:MAG: cobyric acid synthase [Frisingicoccus sp.]
MKAKVIMVQGTMSNSGKSFITAGLCRVFAQDGYRVAPFKSQNMALNSYITKDGLEMGRAQVVQAEAAGVEPTADMNPILLKPTSHTGSQVIVNGRVRGQMKAMDYFKHKTELIPDIMAAFGRLSEACDIIVIEGAGSPAEINLKENDIVNMGLAKMVDAPVLLVGDIDRGGVFASLYGTVKLLEAEEQARIQGLIINKFRGDPEILKPGVQMIEELVHIPVVGVVPMEKIDIDDEDSLSEHLLSEEMTGGLDVAVIRLPHISNFTDFTAFERRPGVSLRYVDRASKLGSPHLILLPGTKNTMADLRWLRNNGLEERIIRLSKDGVSVMGVCGGYQMLGSVLSDPEGVEDGGEMAGMGLLPGQTIFREEKTRTRICGAVINGGMKGCPVEGYEIHMGDTGWKNEQQ